MRNTLLATPLLGALLVLPLAAPALGQTISGCRDATEGAVYNLLEADVPSAPCESGDVDFRLPLARSVGVASALKPVRCGDEIRLSPVARHRDFVAFHRFFAFFYEHCLAGFEGHGGRPPPDSPRVAFVGTAPVTMREPVIERPELDRRCAAKFPGSRSCAVCDVVRDDRLVPEVRAAAARTMLVRADIGDGAEFLDAALRRAGSGTRYLTCGGWTTDSPPIQSKITVIPWFGMIIAPDYVCLTALAQMQLACCAPER